MGVDLPTVTLLVMFHAHLINSYIKSTFRLTFFLNSKIVISYNIAALRAHCRPFQTAENAFIQILNIEN